MTVRRGPAPAVQHVQLPGLGERPRPIGRVIQSVLPGLLPEPAELAELTAPDRRRLYDLADLSPLRRAEVEDEVRRAVRVGSYPRRAA
jgi:hypothetical protein